MAFKHLPQLFYRVLFNPNVSTVVYIFYYKLFNLSIPFGHLAQFHSAVWLDFVRPFGAFSFDHLDVYRYFSKKDFKGIK